MRATWLAALLGTLALGAGAMPASAQLQQPLSPGWSQDGGNPQRTGFINEEPAKPWRFAWAWNGPDANMADTCPNGPETGHCYNAPREARTVVGDGKVFAPAGGAGLYAIDLATGKQAWRVEGTFNAAPAYADRFVFAGSADGGVAKLVSASGAVAARYDAGSPVDYAVLAEAGFVYAVSQDGRLHKIDAQTMSPVWTYNAGAGGAISMAYSSRKRLIVYATDDLHVHAVNDADGTGKWRVKPSVHEPAFDYRFSWGWPVIAEQRGIVFLRMRLDRQAVYARRYPERLSDLRRLHDCAAYPRECAPEWENLFALSLDTGKKAFYPLVGYGSIEFWDAPAQQFSTDQGGLPVIKTLPGGKQVAYVQWRNGSRSNRVSPGSNDGRNDSELGEMVLDGTTVAGYRPGDVRFISLGTLNPNNGSYERSNASISDEQSPLTMAGNTLFYSHWAAMESVRVTDRSARRGNTFVNPIRTEVNEAVVRDATCPEHLDKRDERFCANPAFGNANIPGSYLGRVWGSDGGWYTYLDVLSAPGSPMEGSYSAGPLPRYTYVSNGHIIVEGNGGELMAFRHSGR